jgi:1-deoxy-D-xylulose-5-phosphate reductoisomerase
VKTLSLLGSTGSIGTQTLDVVNRFPDEFQVQALGAGRCSALFVEQVKRYRPALAVVASDQAAAELKGFVAEETSIVVGEDGLRAAAAASDIAVNAVVGFAGLPVTLAALAAGKRLALANKESLIAAAPVVERVRSTPGAEIVPVDSEHCAIHQCLGTMAREGSGAVKRIILTASGGPFREYPEAAFPKITVEQALAHPTWDMGPKITVDCSTLMNKGLEVIEAHALFGVPYDQIDVVVHPQSIVHSMVELVDGSTLAQLSLPDMRLPIAYALGYPDRLAAGYGSLDFSSALQLSFEAPRLEQFPCLDLAYEAGRLGGAAPAWLSAANEVAVEAFLEGKIQWMDIATLVESVLNQYETDPLESAEAVLVADKRARDLTTAELRIRMGG